RIDGVGEVPSIEVGTGHVVTTAWTQQFAVVTLQFYAALRTILADILLLWLGLGKFYFDRGGVHRFSLTEQMKAQTLGRVCANASRMRDQHLFKVFFGNSSDYPIDDLTILKQQNGRDAHDSVATGDVRVVVRIQLT